MITASALALLDHRSQGERSFEMGNLDDALSFYQLALEETPDDPRAYNQVGFVLESLGRYDEHYQSEGRS